MTLTVSVLSLVVAALAVFFGPVVTLIISRKQSDLSRRIADKQIIAPMRLAWIENLREKIAELTSSAVHYWNKDWSNIPDYEKDIQQKRLTLLEHEITLRINPSETDHQELVKCIRRAMVVLNCGPGAGVDFGAELQRVIELGQKIFKTEWNRVKEEIAKP
jgi:hypothetical protein